VARGLERLPPALAVGLAQAQGTALPVQVQRGRVEVAVEQLVRLTGTPAQRGHPAQALQRLGGAGQRHQQLEFDFLWGLHAPTYTAALRHNAAKTVSGPPRS